MDELPSTPGANQLITLIHEVRGTFVLLDSDLAGLYGVATRELTRAVKRHLDRFPPDFMFQLAWDEWDALRSQIGISMTGRGGRQYQPYVFTEEGVAMLSSVLNSPRAVQVNIAIMRAFVGMRRLAASHAELAARLDALEADYDEQFRAVFEAIRELMSPDPAPSRRLGFITRQEISA
ncbi:MAG: ORF6N domain-containing protein [Dehalococcoidia bacterium]